MNYKTKYLKYKTKYLKLKKLIGGTDLDDFYRKITGMLMPNEKINLSKKDSVYNIKNFFDSGTIMEQGEPRKKPNAYWTSHGYKQFEENNGWIDWAIVEMPQWINPETHDIYFVEYIDDPSKILLLDTQKKIIDFTNKYGDSPRPRYNYSISDGDVRMIDWRRVKDDGFYGVNATPFLHELGIEYEWYRPWVTGSQAIWDSRGIKSVRKVSS